MRRKSNFVTGGINAVTKSGTNTLKGTGYIYYNNEDMHGNRIDGKELADRDPEEQTTLGFTLGGPIVRNKLFFFLNYEGLKKPAPATHATNNDMDRVRQHMLQRYGYDVGSYANYPNGRTDSRFLIRLDWNMNLNHHMTLRFNHTTNRLWDTPSTYATDAARCMNTSRTVYFSNSMFQQISRVTTFSFDLHSRFGQQFSNQLLITWSDMRDTRSSDSEPFPFIDIMGGYDASTQTQTQSSYMSIGYELFAWNNAVKSSVTTMTDNLTYYHGNHKLTAGVSWEHQSNRNFYIRNGLGYYRYRSLDEFLNGDAPETVAISYGYDGDSKPFTRVRFNQFGIYLQDEWNVTPKQKLSIGLRADKLSLVDSDVHRNNIVYGLDFGGRHISTGRWPDIPVQWTRDWDSAGMSEVMVPCACAAARNSLPDVCPWPSSPICPTTRQ